MSVSDQTQMAVLGGLSVAPMTGYALREQIRDTLGQFWSESFGQIYPALTLLERDGLIERRETLRAGSSVFAVTPAGLQRLRELLAEAPAREKPRNGLLLRLFFGRQLGPDACRQLVLDAQRRAEAELAGMSAIRAEIEADDSADAPYILLTVMAGEHAARATLAWAHDAMGLLERQATATPRSQ